MIDELSSYNFLGQNVGKETLIKEYKKYCLKKDPSDFLEPEELENIIRDGTWYESLSYLISESLKEYIILFLPKYITTFSNSNLDGKLILGIDDFGEITGIPSLEKINPKDILDIIKLSITKNLKTDISIENILDNIKFEVKELEIKPEFVNIDESEPLYEKYLSLKEKYRLALDEYNDQYIKWYQELHIYSIRLFDLINSKTTRQELIKYIINRNSSNEKIDIDIIISLLKSEVNIYIPLGEEIYIRKDNPDDIIYWLVKFKDENVQSISIQKPKKPILNCCFTLSSILSNISNMRHKFIKDTRIKYYLIIIDIYGSKLDQEISYTLNNKEWIVQSRKIGINGEPSSV